MRDRLRGTTERVSVGPNGAQANGSLLGAAPSLSADGRLVAFLSRATDLVPGDTNGASDVFLHGRLTGATERVSVSSSGAQGDGSSGVGASPSISARGHFVAFESAADNLVPGDTNNAADILVRHR